MYIYIYIYVYSERRERERFLLHPFYLENIEVIGGLGNSSSASLQPHISILLKGAWASTSMAKNIL